MNAILRIIAVLAEYFITAWERREKHKRSRVGEIETLQEAVSAGNESKLQSIFKRWRLRGRVADDGGDRDTRRL